MGLYDSVWVPCPSCGHREALQSKGGDCSLSEYELEEAPADVLGDVNRHPAKCAKCGTSFKVIVQCFSKVVRT